MQAEKQPLIPVWREESKNHFVDVNEVALTSAKIGDCNFPTSALKVNDRCDLLSISSIDGLIADGTQDATDVIDPDISLSEIHVKVSRGDESEVLVYDTAVFTTSAFTFCGLSSYREMVLNFNGSFPINEETKTADGKTSTLYSSIGTSNIYQPHFDVNVTGTINLELGNARVDVAPITEIKNGSSSFQIEVIGYRLQTYRTNLNRKPKIEAIAHTFKEKQTLATNLTERLFEIMKEAQASGIAVNVVPDHLMDIVIRNSSREKLYNYNMVQTIPIFPTNVKGEKDDTLNRVIVMSFVKPSE